MKKFLAVIVAAMLTLTLVACGSTPASSAAPAPSSSAAPAPVSSTPAPAQQEFVIGLDDQFPPMGFRDDQNNIVGFDIDLATEVANRLGMVAVPTPIDWSTKELELQNGNVDVLWNGMTITPERQETMLMSAPYIKNAQVVMVAKDSGIASLADLEGKNVAMQEGSSAQGAYANCAVAGKEASLVTAPDNITLFQDLKIGRIDAVVVDKVVADYYITENGEGKLELVSEQLEDEDYGFAFAKDNSELADKVFQALTEMVEDGTAAEISKKWFGEDRVVFGK